MPAGIFMVLFTSMRSAPFPLHFVQGLVTMLPVASQLEQDATLTYWPKSDCWTRRISPVPSQFLQVDLSSPFN